MNALATKPFPPSTRAMPQTSNNPKLLIQKLMENRVQAINPLETWELLGNSNQFLSSIKMSPLFGVINFNIKANIVLLPAPEAPTNAVTSPFLISKNLGSVK